MRYLRSNVTNAVGLAGCLGVSLSLLGCARPTPPEASEQERHAIIGGVLSGAEDDGVVFLIAEDHGCSGSLIAPNVVLTALHCVTEGTTMPEFTCNSDGTPAAGSDMLGPLFDPVDVEIYQGTMREGPVAQAVDLFGTGSTNPCQDDIALVVLDRELELPLSPVRLERETKPGELGRAVGYGRTNNDPALTEDGRHVREHVRVLDVGDTATSEGSNFALPNTLTVGEGPCKGDSGGPLISEDTGAVMGVFSILLSGQCSGVGVRSAYTLVAPYKSLILAALDAADQQPIPEPTASSGAGGEAGASGEGGDAGALGQGGALSGAAGSSGAGGKDGAAGRASSAGAPAGGSGGTAGEDGMAGENAENAGSAGVRGASMQRTNAGCGCRATRATHESSWLLISAAVIALWRRRR